MEKQSKDQLDDKTGNMSNKREEIDQSLQTTDLLQMIHQMKEKQLELEKQNEQLMRIHAETAEVYRQYTDLYDFAPVGYFTLARDGSFLRANLPGADLLSADYGKLTYQTLAAFISDESLPAFYNFHERLLSSTGRQICELKLLNSEKWVQIESTCFEGGEECRAVVVDISDRKRISALLHARLRISEAADTYDLDGLLQKALDEAEALTGSQIGFAHFLQEDQKTLHLQMWSSNTLNHMCTAEGKGSHYPVEEAGVWAECVYTREPVIHNDYANLPHRKGLPEGHAPIHRELIVPVL
ncbi:MAG: GAF domain-containing protein, partial [Anaerolineales bacterium]|nr:GAF domain-containing protein [Anaerolineales bacterium]